MPKKSNKPETDHTVPSNRPATLDDLGKILGLSTRAVSQALHDRPGTVKVSEKTKARVVALAKSMGYRPNNAAKSLTTGRTGMFGILAGFGKMHIRAMHLATTVEVFRSHGVTPVVFNAGNTSEEDLEFSMTSLINARVDGVVLLQRHSSFQESHVAELRKYGMSVVQVGSMEGLEETSHYSVDWSHAYRPALMHLLEQGHKRIGGLVANQKALDKRRTGQPARQRTRSSMLEAANEARNLGHNFHFQFYDYDSDIAVPDDLHPLYHIGYVGMKEIIRRNEVPDALMCQVDGFSFGAMRACKEAGLRIPEDVALTGYGNDPGSSATYIPLTTIEEPFQEMCEKAVVELLEATRVNRQTERKTFLFPTRLVVRASSLRV